MLVGVSQIKVSFERWRGPDAGASPNTDEPLAMERNCWSGTQFVITRLVFSHAVEDDTFESELVKSTFHETESEASTVTVVLVVDLDTGDDALLRVNDCAGRSTVPVQSLLSKRVNDRVPFMGAPCADVRVAESLGSQVWCVLIPVVSFTTKHSLAPLSLEGL